MSKVQVNLYDRDTLHHLQWPESEEGYRAKNYLEPLLKDGVSYYFDNIQTKLAILKVNEHILPITINQEEPANSYVCSLHSQYVSYAKDQTHNKPYLMKCAISSMTAIFSRLIKWGKIDRLIIVNNWLISTNLYPKLTDEELQASLEYLKRLYPKHFICFRSINTYDTKPLLESLKKSGCEMIFSRPIFMFDPTDKKSFSSRMMKSDLKLLKETHYTVLDHEHIPLSASQQICKLYRSLYLEKYSHLNPQMNPKFFELVMQKRLFHLKALQKDGEIEGILGFFSCNGVMTSPLFGYNTKQEGTTAYRLISTLLALAAKDQEKLLNQSAGAGSFKTLRRATKHLEYHAAYCRHLSLSRKICWKLLKGIINSFGIPAVKHFDI